jgi:CRP-like cAMP-binding protein
MASVEQTGSDPSPGGIAAQLRRVPFLSDLDDTAHEDVEAAGTVRRLRDGAPLVTELEAGSDVHLLLEGRIEVTVGTGGHAPARHVAWLEPGASIGEIAAFTGELRSATATARGPATVLTLEGDAFHALCARHPRIAVGMARILAARQQETDRTIAALLAPRPEDEALPGPPPVRLGVLRRAWLELVQNRRRELPFLLLASFVAALLGARAGVFLALQAGVRLLPLLRALYLGGLGLTAVASLLGLLYFRPRLRRAVCIACGVGLALALNELSVFVAFDVFYLDMTTRDPRLEFDVALLYRRSESLYAIMLLLALALQATYLRRFYRRLAFDVGVRLKALFRRRAGQHPVDGARGQGAKR